MKERLNEELEIDEINNWKQKMNGRMAQDGRRKESTEGRGLKVESRIEINTHGEKNEWMYIDQSKVKVKLQLSCACRTVRVLLHSFLAWALAGAQWSASLADRLSWENVSPVFFEQDAGCAAGSFWMLERIQNLLPLPEIEKKSLLKNRDRKAKRK